MRRFASVLLMGTQPALAGACDHGDRTSSETRVEAPGQTPQFVDVTDDAGITFVHSMGDEQLSNLVESTGGGAAFVDYDQDGLLDIYVANGSHRSDVNIGDQPTPALTNHLYRNRGDGTFEDVSVRARVADESYGIAVAVGDYDNDGYPDIYVCNYGPNVLYHNEGNGTFESVTDLAGVGGNSFSVAAAWLDYDNDGLLDLYVGNYVEFDPTYQSPFAPEGFHGPLAYRGQPDILYHNRGDGSFEDMTIPLGILRPDGRTMGLGAADYNDDGYTDIYVANDAMENYLFRNMSGRAFSEVAVPLGVALNLRGNATSSMTVAFGDYDGDGGIDMFVPDMSYGALYRNDGEERFTDMTNASGLATANGPFIGWAAGFIDYDNDRDLDIFQVNGDDRALFGQEDVLFENVGAGRFENVAVERGRYFQRRLVGRGAAFGDYDNDGDIDAFIVNLGGRAVLLNNESNGVNSWITLSLEGRISNRDGVGTRVNVTTDGGTSTAQKTSSGSYLSQNDPRLHFGLGTTDTVEHIEITWPSGTVQVLDRVPARQIVKVVEPGS